ncbi:Putative membrane spanning protein [Staphylococcus aureus]|uniref:hypothetical protein n=1 Tax=Staphylococcus aureus TaxID=1280 RepID=UPI0013115C4A|nr:hypothetical protein [Staphylococcus aureus]CAA3713763.1 membrane spanning protein [Staphylococcus aureus]CAA3746662.1 membrane spanning protein [Staphylococcus aureus]CAA3753682.1 membrane spanning protein [Staphylococcus aureus]CAA3773709.1 membrane spanning protein [Staphylococcus aureus]CAA3806288.1 membrane spanning protein [Staphylococcus aureus]
MALIVSRAILFLILALAFGIATVFPEQKLPLYIVFTLFVAVAIVSNVWFTHQNVKKHIIKFNKYVAYFLSFVSGLLYIGFVIYTLTIGSYDVLPIIIFAISIVLVQILENILGISIKNTRLSNKHISKQRVQQFKVISLILVSVSIVFIFIALMLKWWLLLVISIIVLIIITVAMIVYEKYYTTPD